MNTIRRKAHLLLAGLILAGAVLTAAPQARAVSQADLAGQVEIVDKNTTFYTDRTVAGDFRVTGGTLNLSRKTMTVSGSFYLDDGTVKLNGATLNILGDLYVGSNLDVLHGKINVRGRVIHTAGKIDLGMGSLTVGSDYFLASPKTNALGELIWDSSRGQILMRYPSDTLTIGGDFYMDAIYGTSFKAGTMSVAGSFIQMSDYGPQKFLASKNHKLVFNGTKPQTITMENAGSAFARVEVTNPQGLVVTDYFAAAELTAPSGKVYILSDSATFQDVSLNVPQVIVTGDLTQNGDLKLNYNKLSVEGNLIHTDGTIDIGWGVLDIDGSYYLATPQYTEEGEVQWLGSHGALTMQYPRATMNVGRDFYMNAADSTYLTAGKLTVSGNFTQAVDYTAKKFLATNNHQVILNGKETQTITFQNPNSTFATLTIDNPEGVRITDYLSAWKLNTAGSTCVKLLSEGAVFKDVNLDSPAAVIGDLIQDGDLNLGHRTLRINGNLTHIRGDVDICTGTLMVEGDYYIATPDTDEDGETIWLSSYGRLIMKFPNATLMVGGDFYADSVVISECTSGKLGIGGEFTEIAFPDITPEIEAKPDVQVPAQQVPIVNIMESSLFGRVHVSGIQVWVSAAGPHYHNTPYCRYGPQAQRVTYEQARAAFYTPCEACYIP